MAMFRKSSHGDVKKSAQKVADPKKDSYTRLKHLKTVLESYDTQEAKAFFEGNYSHIYYIFYDVFVGVETDLKQRANKAHREELESILHIFEKILLLLPELIHKRWMFHSIGGIMKKLLHPGNSVKLRREGTRLFIIWYQVLQENASDECHQIYLSLVTGLGDIDLLDVINKSGAEMHGGIIAAGEITPLLPGTGEKLPENLSKYFLEALLTFMVSEVVRVEWLNKEMREAGFVFLFDKFKASYLDMLLPNFDHSRSIYEPQLDLPEPRPLKELLSIEVSEDISACQDLFVRWIANFAITMKKADSSSPIVVKSAAAAEESTENTEDKVDNPDQMPGSQTSTLSNGSQSTEKDSVDTSIASDDHSMSEYEIVRSVLYSTRENVSIVQEIFRQALMFSLNHASAMKRVIGVYKDWFQHAEQRPIFMHEPCVSCTSVNHQGIPDFFHSLSDIIEECDESPASLTPRHTMCLEPPLDASLRMHSTSRNASYLGAVEDLADSGDSQLCHLDVRAGLQKVLQIFITNAANVFLLDVDTDEEMLSEQVDLCKRVLSIFRHIVINMPLQQQTWEQILKILLCITGGVLKTHPPKDRSSTLGGRLAQPIFQTLIVTWIKANLNVYISATLWDQFLQVLSSLTRWEELIKEWAKTMETLTRVLARQVYGLDLNDLPLQRLSEQKEKRRRGRDQSNYGHHKSHGMDKTFSHAILSAKITPPTGGVSAPALDMPFERERGKYKSDGAGGKIRSDGSKVTSSGNPSPTHSRSASNSSDHVPILRSSSEGNLATGESRLKGASFCSEGVAKSDTYCISPEPTGGASEDREVARATLGIIPLDSWSVASADSVLVAGADRSGASGLLGMFEQSGDSTSIDKSEYDNVTRSSRTPSPVSVDYKEGSRTPSPTQELPCDVHNKDCPTPDRDSLHIDALASADESIVRQESADGLESELELKSVLRGGDVQGWLPDVAVVLWKRMLCSLGNVNKMEDPMIHSTVFDHLGAILDTLLKIRDNLSVTSDNTSTPSPPELVPPKQLFCAWFFQALKLGTDYKAGRLLAYQYLSNMLVRCHDVSLSPTVLSQFYKVLHHGLTSCDQDVTNVLVRHCGMHFFQTLLPGSTLLMQDFIQAAQSIITTDISDAPRSDAVALLGCLLCFPNHYRHVPVVIEPSPRHLSMMICTDTKDRIVSLLLHAGKQEPTGMARYLAVCSLGIYLYEELHHNTLHSALKDAINVILADLRCLNKMVAKASTDMLLLLCDHVDKLFSYTPQLPKKIIEVLACNISALIPATDSSCSEVDRQLLISMMFCMVEWCMRMPLSLLLETTDSDKSSVYKVFKVLNAAVAGQTTPALSRSLYMSFVDSTADTEFVGLRDLKLSSSMSPSESSSDALADRNVAIESLSPSPSLQSTTESSATLKAEQANNAVQLAARMLMCHLVNHLGHFPMGSQASRLHSNIQEFHDNPDAGNQDDLSPEIFQAPNTQFFVLNQRTLISFLELPAQMNMPGGGVTAGLTTAKTVCRVLVRDLSGKFCWDSAVLYGPPWCTKSPNNSFLHDTTSNSSVLTVPSDFDLEPLIVEEDLNVSIDLPKRPVSQLPMHTNIQHNDDNLDHLLGYIGHTSAECHLIPGVALNIPAPLPEEVNNCAEDTLTDMVLTQKDEEIIFYSRHKSDVWMHAPPLQPQESQDPVSAFHMCRTMLNQLGLLSWEKRCNFDLLRKSDKLLRELKHLDSQKCRETHKFAVIYVAKGQEDKCSVLANTGGSKVYEDFVAGLGWEVELETHQGFIGGLQQNKTTGDTAPYYATSTLEIIFHVSTRLPFGTDEAMHRKMRHLGNDEVHIVWSEHDRDYRRGIIPTEFGDVIIVIYPLSNGLFRIQINKKPEIPNFGPLFDGAIVDRQVLPGLVRATAVNAGRVKRTLIPFYHPYYEERSKCLDTIIATHSYPTMFEEFAANIFAPVLPQSIIADQGILDMPSSASGSDLVRSASSQLSSPSVTRSTRENETASVASTSPPSSMSIEIVAASHGIVARTAKRLSMKTRKSSNSKPFQSPPASPKNNGKNTSSKKNTAQFHG